MFDFNSQQCRVEVHCFFFLASVIVSISCSILNSILKFSRKKCSFLYILVEIDTVQIRIRIRINNTAFTFRSFFLNWKKEFCGSWCFLSRMCIQAFR